MSITLPPNDYDIYTRSDGSKYYVCTMREIVCHTIGLDNRRPYTRHGRKFYRPYRNYFCCKTSGYPWPMLVNAGYAKHSEVSNDGMTTYWLTRKGLDWLGEELGVHIYDVD